ncbi:7,8 dihydropteroate synthase (methanopterin) [Methanosarcina siciliae T4/M]|uniref:7,8 dihydropteroate synthase (Methanopterin) n=1 Tax=Methanosarcina siciliae T4/M TaxID=1434120 RepID=A0A0E3P4V8_9EURY|nr:7,8 dihydropteroate synthase (methanopterin) [Methanosarcina siciliae T4/M]
MIKLKGKGLVVISGCACTGWKAINRFAEEMPEQFILNSVGTIYSIRSAQPMYLAEIPEAR